MKCAGCRNIAIDGKNQCQKCLDNCCKRQKAYRARQKALGISLSCNNRPAEAARLRAYRKTDKGISAKKMLASNARQLKIKVKTHYGCLNPGCPCMDSLPPYCLDFHHIDSKSFQLGNATRSLQALIAEMNKCTILCAVCHRMETWGDLDASNFIKCNLDNKGNPI